MADAAAKPRPPPLDLERVKQLVADVRKARPERARLRGSKRALPR
jgi:hypothetical protein